MQKADLFDCNRLDSIESILTTLTGGKKVRLTLTRSIWNPDSGCLRIEVLQVGRSETGLDENRLVEKIDPDLVLPGLVEPVSTSN